MYSFTLSTTLRSGRHEIGFHGRVRHVPRGRALRGRGNLGRGGRGERQQAPWTGFDAASHAPGLRSFRGNLRTDPEPTSRGSRAGRDGRDPRPRLQAPTFARQEGGLDMVPESGRDSGSAFDPGWPFCGAHDSPHFFLRPYIPLIWSLPGTDTSARTLLPASVPTRVLGASSRAGPLLFWPCIDLLVHRPASRSSLASLVTSHVEG
ncbi:hypothetical protein Naga_100798g1 [Nannochloropsis gaditana]|uniref:Uncharacterized protein n=1 Tax=Nannochloropsis gaditana TaxID=72520 RepID=W7TM78_9STRA|nr:hypothetical protein Naga_100798g1 [Nannochloropsis gaditana]